MGTLYLIGYNDLISLRQKRSNRVSAVYPESPSHLANLYVGGEELRKLVRPHRGFVELEQTHEKEPGLSDLEIGREPAVADLEHIRDSEEVDEGGVGAETRDNIRKRAAFKSKTE
ncbi:uncharacterized protein DFL_005760 [Arthrobotrys flagrans]|uniref:Uncharacterized protein n=1 Tax=Arthrobotrys flagrans TaxID=97331 RepID=A0A436ZZ46_ARTFL|nr:hypothetical protein DFL_005760 [Arthrobotrys flagrans]